MDFSITCLTSLDLRYYLMKNFGNPNVLKSLTKTMIVAMCIGLVVIYLFAFGCFLSVLILTDLLCLQNYIVFCIANVLVQ